jgi:formamidopyrimidine-DNA glycosylase
VPELPDVTVYLEALEARVLGHPLERVRVASPFLLRTVEPPLAAVEGRIVRALRRLGKRLVLVFDGERFLVLHLMVAGRLRWKVRGAPVPRRLGLAAFDFPTGTAILTEASKKKRAALHVLAGEAALAGLSGGGLEVLEADLGAFRRAIGRERHTLKRTLTDPRILAGIGNAYSDEILHRARLSPVCMSDRLSDDESERLFEATRATLTEWTDRLRAEVGDGFPEKVTAFRPDMAVHGRYGKPCPTCGTPVQRIVRAEHETNYCPPCQTNGKLLADRSLSRLLHADWPRTLDEMEERRETSAGRPPAGPKKGDA